MVRTVTLGFVGDMRTPRVVPTIDASGAQPARGRCRRCSRDGRDRGGDDGRSPGARLDVARVCPLTLYSLAMARQEPLPFDPIEEAARQWGLRWGAVDEMRAVTNLMRVQQLVLGELDEILRPHGLTFARYEALVLLTFSRRGALPLGKMGERLQVHPTSVTSIVDRLEAAGRGTPAAPDRRPHDPGRDHRAGRAVVEARHPRPGRGRVRRRRLVAGPARRALGPADAGPAGGRGLRRRRPALAARATFAEPFRRLKGTTSGSWHG